MPDKMSDEKRRLLEASPAKVVVCPWIRPSHPEQYISVAKEYQKRIRTRSCPISTKPNQSIDALSDHRKGNLGARPAGRSRISSREWDPAGRSADAGRYLKEKNANVKVIGVDPSRFTVLLQVERNAKPDLHGSKIEGIGEDFIPSTVDLTLLDEIVQVSDKEAYQMARRLARKRVLFTRTLRELPSCGRSKSCRRTLRG